MGIILRAQVVLNPVSALPKDRVVNTFHFLATDDTPAVAEVVAELVREFYVAIPTGDTAAPMDSIALSVADTGHEVRVYEYDEVTGERISYNGAPPVHVEAFDFVGRAAETIGLPQEIALCVSMRDTATVTVPAAQRTGRVYIGPIENAVGEGVGPGSISIPSTTLTTRLARAADDLKEAAITAGEPLVVYSRPYAGRAAIERPGNPNGDLPALPARDGTAYEVTQVWVDDEWDVQRRRGRNAGTRTVL